MWRQIGGASLIIAVLLAIGSQAQWANCIYETSDRMAMEFVSEADTDPLMTRIRLIQSDLELEEAAVPAGLPDRAQIAAPYCRKDFTHTGSSPFYAGAILLFVFGLFCRNQARISHDQQFKQRTARRQQSDTNNLFDEPVRPQVMEPELDESLPDGIEVSEDFDLGLGSPPEDMIDEDDGDSLMDFVEHRRAIEENKDDKEDEDSGGGVERFGGFFCPAGWEDKPVLYVDIKSGSARDQASEETERLNNEARPFKSLDAALAYAAKRVVKDTPAIQIRVAPGVYQHSCTVPDRCIVVNHRLPGRATNQQRLRWLMEQGLDDPDRVTILPPTDAPVAVRFTSGQMQGIYGCHLVGREGVPQTGIHATGSVRMNIFNCVLEGFGKSGVRLENAGAELPGHGVNIQACQFLENIAGHGGGLNAKTSVVVVKDCMFQKNRAHSGGAIWAEDLKKPILVRGTRFSHNAAQGPEPGELKPSQVKFRAWLEKEGLGGAVAIMNSKAKFVATEFIDNKSNIGGGAFAVLSAQVLLEGDDEHDVRFHRNASRLGGAVFVLGWHGGAATAKIESADLQHNRAKHTGGAVCGFGLATTQLIDAKVAHNSVEHDRGLGGGIGVQNGAEILVKETDIRDNSSKGAGGGVGAINAVVKIGDDADIRNNKAAMSGGGVFAITEANEEMEELVSLHNFKLPFVFATQDCTISGNNSEDPGAGVRLGNFAPRSTFPMGIKIDGKTRLRNNRTKHPNAAGDDLWIVWNGETKGSGENRPVNKMLLK